MKLTWFFISLSTFSYSSFCFALSDHYSMLGSSNTDQEKMSSSMTLDPDIGHSHKVDIDQMSQFPQQRYTKSRSEHSRAYNSKSKQATWRKKHKPSVRLAMGLLSGGLGQEWVWQNSRKISQLNWQIKATPILQAAISWQLSPRFTVDTQAWHSLQKSNAFMEDFDWMDAQRPERVSHYSVHPATSLHAAHLFDFSLAAALIPRDPAFQLKALLGIQQQQMKWQAKGGRYSYPDAQGQFASNRPVVSYRQNWMAPYIGLHAQYDYRRWGLTGRIKYSAWVKAREDDLHHLRNIKFVSTTQDSQFYMFDLQLNYHASQHIDYFGVVDWTKYAIAKSRHIQIDDRSMGQNGLSNYHSTWKLGIEYRF